MRVFFVKLNKKKLLTCVAAFCLIFATIIFYLFFFCKHLKPVMSYQPVYNGPADRKAVTFTCNVDWGNEYIPQMLEIFEEQNIKATFFISGRWADKFPELLKRIYEEGHIIGCHGYHHKDYSKLDYRQNLQEISMAQISLERITGKKPVFFAPPSGAFNEYTLKAAQDLGCKVIMWSIDTIDWKQDGINRIINRVKKRLHNGGIILMHPTKQTVDALPVIINNIKEEGYEIISLGQLVKLIENN